MYKFLYYILHPSIVMVNYSSLWFLCLSITPCYKSKFTVNFHFIILTFTSVNSTFPLPKFYTYFGYRLPPLAKQNIFGFSRRNISDLHMVLTFKSKLSKLFRAEFVWRVKLFCYRDTECALCESTILKQNFNSKNHKKNLVQKIVISWIPRTWLS